MATIDEIYKNISLTYEKIRDKNEYITRSRRYEINKKIPRIAEIEKKITEINMDTVKLALELKNKAALDEKMADYTKKIEALVNEKQALLKSGGYPQDYLEPVYTCRICKDTGVNGFENCSCFRKYLTEEIHRLSGMKEIFDKENLNTFDLNVYSKRKFEGKELSPYDNAKKILSEIRQKLKTADRSHPCNFIFMGQTGVGKTFFCNCVASVLMSKGFTLHYTSAFQLFKDASDHYFNNTSPDSMDSILNCDVLVIDDLGAEVINSVTKSCFLDIIDHRVRNSSSTLITTNLMPDRLYNTYEERIFSRLVQHYRQYLLYGNDIRMG